MEQGKRRVFCFESTGKHGEIRARLQEKDVMVCFNPREGFQFPKLEGLACEMMSNLEVTAASKEVLKV